MDNETNIQTLAEVDSEYLFDMANRYRHFLSPIIIECIEATAKQKLERIGISTKDMIFYKDGKVYYNK